MQSHKLVCAARTIIAQKALASDGNVITVASQWEISEEHQEVVKDLFKDVVYSSKIM